LECSPRHRPAAVQPNSGEPAAGTGRARAEDDQRVPRPNLDRSLGGGGAGGALRRRRLLQAAVRPAPVGWSHDNGPGRAASFGETRGWRRGGDPVTGLRENWSSAAAAPADRSGPTTRGQAVARDGRATTSFIGDSRARKCPVDRRSTSVCARPDDGGRTDGPRRGARPASEGSPRGVRELQGRSRDARRLGKARGPDAEGGTWPRRGARGRAGVATSRRGLVPAHRFHTRLLQARFSPNF
jgi:hypothetical protein